MTTEQEPAALEIHGSDVLAAARQAARGTFVFGAVLVSLGVFSVVAPLFSGIATAVLVGMLLTTGGVVETLFAFKAPSFGKGALTFLFGGLAVVTGLVMLLQPGEGLGALTMLLAAFFAASGIVDVVLALKLRPQEGWGWTLFSGAVSILLGAFIVWQWPVSGAWAVGVYVGIRLLMHGWILMAVGTTGRDVMAYLRDARLEALEGQVRAGIDALRVTQVAVAANTAMILALDNELRKKVSTDEVDPAIRGLNDLLGEARAEVERTAAASAEAWSAAQEEAGKKFDALQKNTAEMAGGLLKSLGIDQD